MSLYTVSYAKWKQHAQTGMLFTACQPTVRANRIHVWAGNHTDVLKCLVDADDYADWSTTFESSAFVVPDEGHALAALLEASAGGSIPSTNAQSVQLTEPAVFMASKLHYDLIPAFTDIDQGSFKTIYTFAQPGATIYEIRFYLDSSKVLLRMQADGIDILNGTTGLHLRNDVENDLDLSSDAYLWRYASNRYKWAPPEPARITTDFKVLAKSTSGNNKDLETGLIIWRAVT